MTEKLWLDTVHPSYAAAAPHWVFCRQSYEGGPAYFRPNLVKHQREYQEDFEERLQRAWRYNFTSQAVGLVSGHLLKTAPTRKADKAPESVKRFWAKATKDGAKIDTFARDLADWSSVYGRLYIVIDVPSDGGIAPTTELDRQQRGLEPYAYTVAPDDVLDLAYDSDGKLLWAKILERHRDDQDPRAAADGYEIRYRLWERGKWSLYRKAKGDDGKERAELLDEGTVPFSDRLSIVILEHKDGNEYTSPGLVDDLVYIDRSIFNLNSELDETITQQTFSQLMIPSDALPDSAQQQHVIEMGKKRIFTYNAEAKTRPGFESPDASQGTLILDTIEKRCQQAHDSVNLGDEVGGSSREGSSNASGVTMAYRFEKLESGLATKASEQEEAELEIANIVDLWTGGKGQLSEALVSYSRKFDVVSLQQALKDALSIEAALAGASPTALAEMRKQLVAKSLERVEPEVLEMINAEIDAFAAIEKMEPLDQEDDEEEGEPDQMMGKADGGVA